ncbi:MULTISPECIES: antiterminator LoaP [Paenibacillus]|uniref:antiterminator LoaP n=1 Tax=Paenibacillus TaxID=44249 RepID=UPI0005CDDB6E|nr:MULTISPECIES: antiterminator LoaP [Paenibacillus]KAF6582996.1 antiterminator LoaP [Paenibacillus sp. EKM211P]KJD38706.1 transcription antiterminator [Paenibacillus polymyxa]MBE3650726.1 antiterminator LoaP [Paenibacillus polymyxa]MBY7740142.1 antiterminator LoaP [Paenibacillus polymyxa]MEE4580513.1 antiterminator LoaP [Paenibacillus polymyxa]
MPWYALFIENGKEEIVQRFIRMYFTESSLISIVPRRKIPEKKEGIMVNSLRLLFPGYILIKTDMTEEIYYTLNKIPCLYKIVSQGCHYSKKEGFHLSTISDAEIDLIQQLINENEVIDYSQIYVEGSKVTVQSGPLTGLEAIIKKIDKHKKRAKIRLNFMKSERTVDVGIEIISNNPRFT